MKESCRSWLVALAERGIIKDLTWWRSLPDNLGRSKRKCYFTTTTSATRETRERIKGTVERSLEFSAWSNVNLIDVPSTWSFEMHDVPSGVRK